MLLLDEFTEAFDDADEIIVTDIYAAREKDNGKIHARDLVERLQKRGRAARYVSGFDEIVDILRGTLQGGRHGDYNGRGQRVQNWGADNRAIKNRRIRRFLFVLFFVCWVFPIVVNVLHVVVILQHFEQLAHVLHVVLRC